MHAGAKPLFFPPPLVLESPIWRPFAMGCSRSRPAIVEKESLAGHITAALPLSEPELLGMHVEPEAKTVWGAEDSI